MFGTRARRDADDGRSDEASHEAADKPDSPGDLTKQSWFYVVRKTVREFSDDQCTDLAAALTYYSVLALFPAAIAILSLVGLVGQGRRRSTRCCRSCVTSAPPAPPKPSNPR